MRKIWFQIWRRVNYQDRSKFRFWSRKIRGEGDRDLVKGTLLKHWKKVIILRPIGASETSFSMGFADVFGNTKISTAKRQVKEGVFGMRMGPEDCDFFIASRAGRVGLAFVEYAEIDDETKSGIFLY